MGKAYGTGEPCVHALREVDLEVQAGELVVLLAPSGAGKTTLLKLIGGIEPPSTGEIKVEGRDISSLDDNGRTAYRRDTVGFVFQFFNLVPALTAMENVRLVAELTGRGGREQTGQALEAVGLADRADHFPAQLTAGQQQRVAIARAIARQASATPVSPMSRPARSLELRCGCRTEAPW